MMLRDLDRPINWLQVAHGQSIIAHNHKVEQRRQERYMNILCIGNPSLRRGQESATRDDYEQI